MINPKELDHVLGALLKNPGQRGDIAEIPFRHIVTDSRKVCPGDLFIALHGERTDGHKYLDDAIRQGASGLLTQVLPNQENPETLVFLVADTLAAIQKAGSRWRRLQRTKVIGITGSVGKTTVREVITQILQKKFTTFQTPNNLNSEIGLPIAMLGLTAQHQWAVLELGPYSQREMSVLCSLAEANVGVITNVGPTHLERFGTLTTTAAIKGTLIAELPENGLAILNADDDSVLNMRKRTNCTVITYGLSASSDVRATSITTYGLDGLSFTLHYSGSTTKIRTRLIGAHHVKTILAATAAVIAVNKFCDNPFDIHEITNTLGSLNIGSRLKPTRTYNGALILDDAYNSAPLSVKAALDLLADLPGRRTAVLGDMLELGKEELSGHQTVGTYTIGRCDQLIAVGHRAKIIADAAWNAGHQQVQWFEEQQAATKFLRKEIGADDVVLVKASHAMELNRMIKSLLDETISS